MKFALTGITSGVGLRLAEVLRASGHEVRGLVRDLSKPEATQLRAIGVSLSVGDLGSMNALVEIAREADAFFHLAAHVGDWGPAAQFVAVNVGGTRRAVEAAARASVKRFVYLSSTAVYGGAARGRVDETCPTFHSGLPYEDTKLDAERVAFATGRVLGLEVVAVRPPGIYGPYDRNFMPRVVDALAKRRCILIEGGRAPFNLVWVDHLVDVLVKCASAPGVGGESFNVADETSTPPTVREALEAIARGGGFPKPSLSLPYGAAMAVGHVLQGGFLAARWKTPPPITPFVVKMLTRHVVYDSAKAERVLGYERRKRSIDGLFDEANALVTKMRGASNVHRATASESSGASRGGVTRV